MSRPRFVFSAVLATLLLAACGQSGPLYLPGDPSQVTTIPPATEAPDSPGSEAQENGEDGSD